MAASRRIFNVAFDDVLRLDELVGFVHYCLDAFGEAGNAPIDAKADGQYAENAKIAAQDENAAGQVQR